jgi:hypothetical protein
LYGAKIESTHRVVESVQDACAPARAAASIMRNATRRSMEALHVQSLHPQPAASSTRRPATASIRGRSGQRFAIVVLGLQSV